MSCPKCGSGNIAKEKTMRGWSDDYVCCDCGYNDSKDAFGERGKNDFVKINKEREVRCTGNSGHYHLFFF